METRDASTEGGGSMSEHSEPLGGSETPTKPPAEHDTAGPVGGHEEQVNSLRPDPLIEEAAKRAAIAWLTPGGAVWCLWLDGALYVVSGPGEQPAPGLATAQEAIVTLRGDHGGRIATWRATVERVDPSGEEWTAVVPQLTAKRLNLPAAEDTMARWASSCVLSKLVPIGALEPISDDSHAAEVPPSPASRRTKSPFKLHRVRRPR
jgi:hypothetical protein